MDNIFFEVENFTQSDCFIEKEDDFMPEEIDNFHIQEKQLRQKEIDCYK